MSNIRVHDASLKWRQQEFPFHVFDRLLRMETYSHERENLARTDSAALELIRPFS